MDFFCLGYVTNRIAVSRNTVSKNGLFPVCAQGTVPGATRHGLYAKGSRRRRVQPCAMLLGKQVCTPTCCSCRPSSRPSGELRCEGCLLGRVFWAEVLRAAWEGEGWFRTSRGFTVGHSKGLLGSPVQQGQPLLAMYFLSVTIPAAFPPLLWP